jgi:hypothetical protein
MFDPEPLVLRRFDIPGGLGKRFLPLTTLLVNQLQYYHRVVSEYFPFRFFGLFPLFMIYSFQYTTRWFRIYSYYKDSIWIQWFGDKHGQRLYIFQELVRFPILVLRTFFEKKPRWRGELTVPVE